MNMLYKYQYADGNTANQRKYLISFLLKSEKQSKLAGCMAGVKQVFGDKSTPIKRVT
jgi:hypothetical protein